MGIDWRWYKNLFFFLVVHTTHWGMYVGNMVALVYVIIYMPWFIILPFVTFLGNPLIGGIQCSYNNLENVYRYQLGWKPIQSNFLPTVVEDIKMLINTVTSKKV